MQGFECQGSMVGREGWPEGFRPRQWAAAKVSCSGAEEMPLQGRSQGHPSIPDPEPVSTSATGPISWAVLSWTCFPAPWLWAGETLNPLPFPLLLSFLSSPSSF